MTHEHKATDTNRMKAYFVHIMYFMHTASVCIQRAHPGPWYTALATSEERVRKGLLSLQRNAFACNALKRLLQWRNTLP